MRPFFRQVFAKYGDNRAVLTTLAERQEKHADLIDAFADRIDDTAVAEAQHQRALGIRTAARDLRDVLNTGRLPDDLLTNDELTQAERSGS